MRSAPRAACVLPDAAGTAGYSPKPRCGPRACRRRRGRTDCCCEGGVFTPWLSADLHRARDRCATSPRLLPHSFIPPVSWGRTMIRYNWRREVSAGSVCPCRSQASTGSKSSGEVLPMGYGSCPDSSSMRHDARTADAAAPGCRERVHCGGFGRRVTLLLTYVIRLLRGRRPLRSRHCAAHEPYVLLGRDVLNQYRILLDGQSWQSSLKCPDTSPQR